MKFPNLGRPSRFLPAAGLIFLFNFVGFPAWGQEKTPSPTPDQKTEGEAPFKVDSRQPIQITSDRMLSEKQENMFVFLDNVVAVFGKSVMNSDRLEVYGEEDQSAVKEIVALGNVKIVTEKRVITSEKAVYYQDGQKIVFTGNPMVEENKNIIVGEKIEYFFEKEDIIVTGGKQQKAFVILYPKNKTEDEKGSPKEESKPE
jgi:lipopolysaccharide export system protein LptA